MNNSAIPTVFFVLLSCSFHEICLNLQTLEANSAVTSYQIRPARVWWPCALPDLGAGQHGGNYNTEIMEKKRLSAVMALLFCGIAAMAQSVPTHEAYIDFGITGRDNIVAALDRWQPGTAWSYDADYIDENFFVSRVPLKPRFTNTATQANSSLGSSNAKKLCWCVPLGEMTKKWGALPRWNFDGDNFNLWQYVTVQANWANGWWRVPGAFNDVAHRNGVKTGCTYFIDWGSEVTEESDAGRMLAQLCAKDSAGEFKYTRKLVRFLHYYGIDGLTINPEGTWSVTLNDSFSSFLSACHREAESLGYAFVVTWYAVVDNEGRLTDSNSMLANGTNDMWFQKDGYPVSDVYFLNYNWNRVSLIQSESAAKELGRSTFDVYASFDQQGRGYGKDGNAGWKQLMKYPLSIVVWGAHDRSQLYINSTEGGTTDLNVQNEYQKKQEMLFTGGTRNVLNAPEVTDDDITASYADLKKWHGYSKAVVEQSTLTELPFVTRFSLGNGQWMKKRGEITFNHKWYNIGVQDLLPTWRWWIDNGDGKTVPDDAIECDFSFDDAWYAGSCLRLHGATDKSSVRLFSTKFAVGSADDEISVTLKTGNFTAARLSLTASKLGSEQQFASVAVPTGGMESGKWHTCTFKASQFGLAAGDTIACLGLVVENTQAESEILLGEYSYIPASFSETPVQPVITHAVALKRLYNRADFKVVFDVPFTGTRKAEYEGCPIYNEEVGAWYYEVYIKQGEAEQLLATTTSWASYVVDAPLNGADETFRVGVRAVGRDGKTVSDIAWSDEISCPLTILDNLVADKEIIKAGETFAVGFEDPAHCEATIEIIDAQTGSIVASRSNCKSIETSLPDVGVYDVRAIFGNDTTMSRALILVSPDATGRLPQVNAITADRTVIGEDGDTEASREVNFSAEITKGDTYTDGSEKPCGVSMGLYIEGPFQLTVSSDVLQDSTHNSFALWFKPKGFEHSSLGTLLMKKVNRNYPGTWTEKIYGEMWTAIRPAGFSGYSNSANELTVNVDAPEAGTDGYDHSSIADGISTGYSVDAGKWYHVCVVKDGKRVRLYLNGRCVIDCESKGSGPKDWQGANFYVGGSMTDIASFTGWIDEVQLWDKALADDEVIEAMKGYATAPDALRGYFTFESQETDADGYLFFPNTGTAAATVGGAYLTSELDDGDTITDVKQNKATTAAGVPAIAGSMPIVFMGSEWLLDGATLNSSTETSANATYNSEGVYPVKLTLTNTWGKTTATMSDYITVKSSTAIDNAATGEGYIACPRAFGGKLNLLFAEDGRFDVSAFDVQGRRVARQAYQACSGDTATLALGNARGVYIVAVTKDGKCLRPVKIVVE